MNWCPKVFSAASASQHINHMAGQPNIELLESRFQPLFEINKELPVCWGVLDVNENPRQFVPVKFARLVPLPLYKHEPQKKPRQSVGAVRATCRQLNFPVPAGHD